MNAYYSYKYKLMTWKWGSICLYRARTSTFEIAVLFSDASRAIVDI